MKIINNIYILLNFNRLEEKSNMPNFREKLCDYKTIVFKSSKGELGFTTESEGQLFLVRYLFNSVFWNRKEERFIDFKTKEEIENNILQLNGLSIFNNEEKLNKEKQNVKDIKLSIKKNEVYKRNRKPVVVVGTSPFLSYYTNENKLDFESLQKLYAAYDNLTLWDWGEFGVYFHILSKEFDIYNLKISTIAKDIGINVKYVENDRDVPPW